MQFSSAFFFLLQQYEVVGHLHWPSTGCV